MRFIHCADLHFDRPFEGLHLIADKVKELAEANQQVLENIVTLALDEQVDFLLFAGDTFHQNRPSLKTQHQFFQQMKRLQTENIQVYLSFGNHDYYEKERYWFEFPENMHIFTEEKVATFHAKTKNGERYAISGFSYHHPWIQQSKVAEFPNKTEQYHIGMYHGDSNGTEYAPFQLQEMKQKGYDYWALGHVHMPTILSNQPPILYSGAPQGHTQKENNVQGVQLVTLADGKMGVESRAVAAVAWTEQEVSLQSLKTVRQVLEKLKTIFPHSQKQLVRLVLTEGEELPKNWLTDQEKSEMIAYLNDFFKHQGYQQLIYQLSVKENIASEGMVLTGRALAEQLVTGYQADEVYSEIISELLAHPLIKQSVDLNELKKATFEQLQTIIANQFLWNEEEK